MIVNSVDTIHSDAHIAIQAYAKFLCCSVNMMLSQVGTQSLQSGLHRSVQDELSKRTYLAGQLLECCCHTEVVTKFGNKVVSATGDGRDGMEPRGRLLGSGQPSCGAMQS